MYIKHDCLFFEHQKVTISVHIDIHKWTFSLTVSTLWMQ